MKKKHPWFKPKSYLHFSSRLGYKDIKFVKDYIKNNLENHQFFPLIHDVIFTRRYKLIDGSTRSHFDFFSNPAKTSAKKREIFYANHLDTQIYSYYSNIILGSKYEELLAKNLDVSDAVIAYRKIKLDNFSDRGKCNIHFANEVFSVIKDTGECVVACYDIEDFFPSLQHIHLKNSWQAVLGLERLSNFDFKVFNSLTKYSYVDLNDVINAAADEKNGLTTKSKFRYHRPKLKSYFTDSKEFREKIVKKNLVKVNSSKPFGIPQGTPLSALLANIYMFEIDKYITSELSEIGLKVYRRYSDDILIVTENLEQFKQVDNEIKRIVNTERYSLKINSDKTKVSVLRYESSKLKVLTYSNSKFEKLTTAPIRYLGFDFDGSRILLKQASLAKYYRSMKRGIKLKCNRVNAAIRFNSRNSDVQKDAKLYKRKLLLKYTHLGKSKGKGNYLSYAHRSAKILYPNLKGPDNPIRRQVRRSWSIFNKTVEKRHP